MSATAQNALRRALPALLALALACASPARAEAQAGEGAGMGAPAGQIAPGRTVPAAVFVGDRAALIAPLPGLRGQGDEEVPEAQLPSAPGIDIHRAALQRRPGGSSLLIEFTAFAPGLIELPAIEIGGEAFHGLAVSIGSVLAPSEPPILSPPAGPLAVPGTALLVYGGIAAPALALLLASLLSARGRGWLRLRLAARRRRRMLRLMQGAERRWRKALAKGAPPREALGEIAAEFRAFLADLSGESFLSMTAREMGLLGLEAALGLGPAPGGQAEATGGRAALGLGSGPGGQGSAPGGQVEEPGEGFLEGFFRRCDGLRFCGREIGEGEALQAFDELRGFLAGLAALPAGLPPAGGRGAGENAGPRAPGPWGPGLGGPGLGEPGLGEPGHGGAGQAKGPQGRGSGGRAA